MQGFAELIFFYPSLPCEHSICPAGKMNAVTICPEMHFRSSPTSILRILPKRLLPEWIIRLTSTCTIFFPSLKRLLFQWLIMNKVPLETFGRILSPTKRTLSMEKCGTKLVTNCFVREGCLSHKQSCAQC